MKPNLQHPIGRIRFAGLFEGISFLLLLGVAMPLKYAFDLPMAVRVVGMAHGILFLALCGLLLHAWGEKKLSTRNALMTFLASLLPFGPFVMDRRLKSEETAEG